MLLLKWYNSVITCDTGLDYCPWSIMKAALKYQKIESVPFCFAHANIEIKFIFVDFIDVFLSDSPELTH